MRDLMRRLSAAAVAAACLLASPALAEEKSANEISPPQTVTAVAIWDPNTQAWFVPGTGGGGGSGTEYTEDGVAVGNPVGGTFNCVRRDTLSTAEVSADGDWIACKMTNKGQLHVFAELVSGTTIAVTGPITNAQMVTALAGLATSAQIGEVQPSPTANTLLDRVKTLHTDIAALQALVGEVQPSPTANTLLDRMKTLQGYLDGVEGLIGTTNTSLTTIAGYVDQLESYVDGLETAAASTNTKLDTLHADIATTLHADVDGLEGLITTLNGKIDTLNAQAASTTPTAVDLTKIASTAYDLRMTAAATTQLIPLSGSLTTYILMDTWRAEGAVNITFKYGTGTNCGTGTTTMRGPFAATTGDGWTEGNGSAMVMKVPAGQAFCVTTDATAVVNIHATAVQY